MFKNHNVPVIFPDMTAPEKLRPVLAIRGGFTYGPMNIERGTIFSLRGMNNDPLLIEHKYISHVSEPVVWCLCGRGFTTTETMSAHIDYNCDHPVVRRLINATRDADGAFEADIKRFLSRNPPS